MSSKAVDGNSNTDYSKGSCAHTGRANNPWWRVDLGRVETVNQVYIVNRGDGWAWRLDSFEIRVGRSQFRLILLYQHIFTNTLTDILIQFVLFSSLLISYNTRNTIPLLLVCLKDFKVHRAIMFSRVSYYLTLPLNQIKRNHVDKK